MSSDAPRPGDVYQQELLHSQATYRVIAIEEGHVTVEAIEVPGLEAGHQLRLTAASLGDMVRLEAPADAADPAATRRQPLPGNARPRPA
ncbi:MAG: hypothetical protein ABW167_17940 [Baekduia sp.]